ncbi:MAG TPA: hypothetical protein VJ486_07440 [Geothrix sp.]|nr:hypothetical protein [Geothrix sp.]
MTPQLASRRRSEQGGITILTTLGLLVLLTVMVLSLSRSSIRELAVTGTVWQAAKASEAAEAGLDWYILWASSENHAVAAGYRRDDLVSALQQLNGGGASWQNNTYHDPTGLPGTWDRSATVTSNPYDTNSDMVFANSGTGFGQSSATTGNTVVQSFDVFFRFLGSPVTPTMSSGAGNVVGAGSGGTGTGRALVLYQVVATGKASVPLGGNNYMNYKATREMYLTAAP